MGLLYMSDSRKKTSSKKTNLIIQLDSDLKSSFQELCRSQDINCSQALRKFMKSSVEAYKRENLKVYKKKTDHIEYDRL